MPSYITIIIESCEYRLLKRISTNVMGRSRLLSSGYAYAASTTVTFSLKSPVDFKPL